MRPWRREFLRALAAGLTGPMGFAVLSAEATAQVDIRDYKFVPDRLTIKPGTTVRWTNHEKRTTHSVLFPAESGLESDRMFPGESWQRRFDKAGTFAYTCGPHPEMKGLIVVSD